MTNTTQFTGPEVLALLDSPALFTYPTDGGVQVKKAGIIGIGSTTSEAAADWARRFAEGIAFSCDKPK
jgi:hypothetical protein